MHEGASRGAPVEWRDRAFTFNAPCYGCQVSQIETTYDSGNRWCYFSKMGNLPRSFLAGC